MHLVCLKIRVNCERELQLMSFRCTQSLWRGTGRGDRRLQLAFNLCEDMSCFPSSARETTITVSSCHNHNKKKMQKKKTQQQQLELATAATTAIFFAKGFAPFRTIRLTPVPGEPQQRSRIAWSPGSLVGRSVGCSVGRRGNLLVWAGWLHWQL